MKPPCEVVIHRFVPALRAEIAMDLHKAGMSQVEIGRRLGTKQPSVSQYLSGLRGADHEFLSNKFKSYDIKTYPQIARK